MHVLRLLTRRFSRERSPKVGIAVGKRDNLRGNSRPALALLQHLGANGDESCWECGDRLYFVLVKLKMFF
jgi:hypothetical protein